MADRSRVARGVVASIDERLHEVESELAGHEELLRERQRLLAARSTLLGEGPAGQITQDDVAGYLEEHPGSRPRQIAMALGVTSGRISAHLSRGRRTRFESRPSGWHLREGQ